MDELNNLLDEMRFYLVAAGIPKNQIRIRGGNHKVGTFAKAFDWLHDLYMHFDYKNHVYVYNLRPPKIWERYTTMHITGLREQVMLKESSQTVRALWKTKRPPIFGTRNRK